MTTLRIEFEEYLTIKSALQQAIVEAKHQAWRGNLHGNAEMKAHFDDHAATLASLQEKLDGQVLYKGSN